MLGSVIRTQQSILPIIIDDYDINTYLVFHLNNSNFALSVGDISDLFMSQIVCPHGALQFLHQGDTVTLCNIKHFLGLSTKQSSIPQNAVICRQGKKRYAFNIDKVDAVYSVKGKDIYYAPIECSAIISGVFSMQGDAVYIIECRDLFDHIEQPGAQIPLCSYETRPDFAAS